MPKFSRVVAPHARTEIQRQAQLYAARDEAAFDGTLATALGPATLSPLPGTSIRGVVTAKRAAHGAHARATPRGRERRGGVAEGGATGADALIQ